MKRAVPAPVIFGMTRPAGVRCHVIANLRLDGTISRRFRLAPKLTKRNRRESARACDRCDNEEPMPPGSRQLRHNFWGSMLWEMGDAGKPCVFCHYCGVVGREGPSDRTIKDRNATSKWLKLRRTDRPHLFGIETKICPCRRDQGPIKAGFSSRVDFGFSKPGKASLVCGR